MRWTREEYISLMAFGDSERPMLAELFGPLVGLDEEWRGQGASEEEISLDAFGFDYVPVVWCGGNTGLIGGGKPKIIKETAGYLICLDELGRKTKLAKGKATLALPMEYPVIDMDSWLRMKPMFSFDENKPELRIDWDQVETARREQENGALVCASIPGGFDFARELMGDEGACVCYYDDPELMADMIGTIQNTAYNVLRRISDKLTIDNLCVHEDMAGKSGPLTGPRQVVESIGPYYESIWDLLRASGTKLFSQDSDGNIGAILPQFMDAGLNITYPCEPAAGMDMVRLRGLYGTRLAFKGGIDKHVLRKGKNEIIRELEYKLRPAMRKGTVFGLDHRITNGTPIENYRFYVSAAREILGLKPTEPENGAWRGMAF